jgi:Mn-dependent DtxR family transcriptional regulator
MIIGSEFSKKNQEYLREICRLSDGDTDYKMPVHDINEKLGLDRTQLKNILEYLQELGYINIVTIGGPMLYGHIKVTEKGLKKCKDLNT